MAMDRVAMAAWALRVSSRPSPLAHRAATSRPSTSEARAKVAATSGTSSRSAPMPGLCDPWPEAMNTVLALKGRGLVMVGLPSL